MGLIIKEEKLVEKEKSEAIQKAIKSLQNKRKNERIKNKMEKFKRTMERHTRLRRVIKNNRTTPTLKLNEKPIENYRPIYFKK